MTTPRGRPLATKTSAVTSQTIEIQADIIQIFDLIDEQRTEEARILIDKLRSRFGDTLPDLTEAETMLALDSDCPPYGED